MFKIQAFKFLPHDPLLAHFDVYIKRLEDVRS